MRRELGFTLIELLVVLVVLTVAWVSLLPSLQSNQQRVAYAWLQQAQELFSFSCDMAAQMNTPYRVALYSQALVLEYWDGKQQQWVTAADTPQLSLLTDWQLIAQSPLMVDHQGPMSWLCSADGEQQAGQLQLSMAAQTPVGLQWSGVGDYALSK